MMIAFVGRATIRYRNRDSESDSGRRAVSPVRHEGATTTTTTTATEDKEFRRWPGCLLLHA